MYTSGDQANPKPRKAGATAPRQTGSRFNIIDGRQLFRGSFRSKVANSKTRKNETLWSLCGDSSLLYAHHDVQGFNPVRSTACARSRLDLAQLASDGQSRDIGDYECARSDSNATLKAPTGPRGTRVHFLLATPRVYGEFSNRFVPVLSYCFILSFCSSSTKFLLHLCHGFLLRYLCFIGFLQDHSYTLLRLEIFGDAPIRTGHFPQLQVGFFMSATGAFCETRSRDFIKEIYG